MQAFLFPSEEALKLALRSGAVSDTALKGEVFVTRLPKGAIEVAPKTPLSAAATKALLALGVAAQEASATAIPVSCWAAALSLETTGVPQEAPRLALFRCDSQATALALAGELVRLGTEHLELGAGEAFPLLKVPHPPWYALLGEREGVRVFAPSPATQATVFVELGFDHPLSAAIDAPKDAVVLVHRDGRWESRPTPKWLDATTVMVPVPAPNSVVMETQEPPRLPVALRLIRASRAEAPSLWVVPRGAAHVEALVRATPEDVLEAVTFAVAGDLVLLRPRPGKTFPGTLPGEAYARAGDLPNLYLPHGTALEPPLRRERLRAWLAPDIEQVTLVGPDEAGRLALRSLPEKAFRPLTEWVDYVLDGAREQLETWVKRATFEFAGYEADADVPSEAKEKPEPATPATRAKAPRAQPAPSAPRPVPATQSVPAAQVEGVPTQVVLQAMAPSELEAAIHQGETAFLEMESAPDAPERRAAWVDLAELYAKARQPRESGLAWAHALWDAPEGEVGALASRWASSHPHPLETLLRLPTPTPEQTRAVVAHAVSGAVDSASGLRPRAASLAAFLDKHDADLDVRALWLGRWALSVLSGRDALALAKARDRVLGRLTRGLSLERDVPRFLRVSGQSGTQGAGGERRRRVAHQLEAIWRAFHETPRKRSAVEAPTGHSFAYVGLELAWGFARLGLGERARQLRAEAVEALPAKDPVHGYLTKAYSARIDQAIEGTPPGAPLPSDLSQLLNGLEPRLRYLVDRVRQVSEVLEPQERLDPKHDFVQRLKATVPGREELAALRDIADPAQLAAALRAREPAAADPSLAPEERSRLLDGLIDFVPQLPESAALPLLGRFIALSDGLPPQFRLTVLEDALKVAGHFGRTALVRQLAMGLGSVISELGAEGVAQLGAALASGMRSLTRVGLRDEARELLARAAGLLKGDEPGTLLARLALAQGFASLGALAQAQPVLDEAFERLSREKGLIFERMKLTRAASHALAAAPVDVALPGLLRLTKQLAWVTDSLSTAPYFCVSLIDYADALVLGHVGDDLTLNEFTRRFLEEDELLVRRRVHKDAGALG